MSKFVIPYYPEDDIEDNTSFLLTGMVGMYGSLIEECIWDEKDIKSYNKNSAVPISHPYIDKLIRDRMEELERDIIKGQKAKKGLDILEKLKQ